MTSATVPGRTSPDHDVPPEQAVIVVDMQAYSRLPEAQMAPVRSDLDSILETAFIQSGLPAPDTLGTGYKDAGDGVILLLPARHTARLVDPLLGNLSAALRRYEYSRMASAPSIRLRAAVHVGPLSIPDHRGDAINEACRLVNSDAAYHALEAAADNGLFLASVLSEPVYRRSVRAGRADTKLTERQFLETTARVNNKPGFAEPCRLFVPGLTAGSLSGYLPRHDSPETPRGGPTPALAGSSHEPGADARPGAGAVFNFLREVRDPVIAGTIEHLRMPDRDR